MIYLNANNDVSNPDIGLAASYNDGTYHHTGVFRDATDGTWKFYYNYDPEPDASPYIDTAHATFRIANLTANLITDVATIRGYDPINHANASYAHANAAYTAANNSVDTWVRDAANSASSYANSAYTTSNTAATNALSAGSYANGAFSAANTADQKAVSAGSYANSAYAAANTAATGASTADQKAVTSGDYANSAYTQANTAVTNAASASSYANSAYTAANSAVTTTGSQTLTNKLLSDSTTSFIDEADASKRMQFQLSSVSSGATRILTVPNYNATIATLSGTETLTSKTLTTPNINGPLVASPKEKFITSTAPESTLNLYIGDTTIHYYTSNATNNFTLNIAAYNDVSLNNWLATNSSVTFVLMVTNGSTAYYPNVFQIDGITVTPKYTNGIAITAGNASAIDMYNFTIFKTASATYTAIMSQTKLA
jgi:hypothetical protein